MKVHWRVAESVTVLIREFVSIAIVVARFDASVAVAGVLVQSSVSETPNRSLMAARRPVASKLVLLWLVAVIL